MDAKPFKHKKSPTELTEGLLQSNLLNNGFLE